MLFVMDFDDIVDTAKLLRIMSRRMVLIVTYFRRIIPNPEWKID